VKGGERSCRSGRQSVRRAADDGDGARLGGRQQRQEIGNQRPKVSESVRAGTENEDRDVERGEILPEGQVSIDRYECIELSGREAEQLPILRRRPSHLPRSLDIVPGKVA